jgi:hypothetical protein
MARLRAAMAGPIDTSDSPEHEGPFHRVKRDGKGQLPQPIPVLKFSPIRSAILKQLGRRQMTRYKLWAEARKHCPQMPRSAVYEYLRGQRAIGVEYVEALLSALGLSIKPDKVTKTKKRASHRRPVLKKNPLTPA